MHPTPSSAALSRLAPAAELQLAKDVLDWFLIV
jgi:hypothetical protein